MNVRSLIVCIFVNPSPNQIAFIMYTYQALDSSEHIRLLILDPAQESAELRCSLISVLPSDETRYEALSYVWGDPTETRRIHVSGDELNITTNLHSALQHLRFKDRKRTLWADAICIDQDNLDERGEQVKLMGQIYTQAEQVLVWLGEMTEDVELSLDSIAHLNEFIGKHDSGYAVGSR